MITGKENIPELHPKDEYRYEPTILQIKYGIHRKAYTTGTEEFVSCEKKFSDMTKESLDTYYDELRRQHHTGSLGGSLLAPKALRKTRCYVLSKSTEKCLKVAER